MSPWPYWSPVRAPCPLRRLGKPAMLARCLRQFGVTALPASATLCDDDAQFAPNSSNVEDRARGACHHSHNNPSRAGHAQARVIGPAPPGVSLVQRPAPTDCRGPCSQEPRSLPAAAPAGQLPRTAIGRETQPPTPSGRHDSLPELRGSRGTSGRAATQGAGVRRSWSAAPSRSTYRLLIRAATVRNGLARQTLSEVRAPTSRP